MSRDGVGSVYWTDTYTGVADIFDAAKDVAVDANDEIIVVGSVQDGAVPEFWMRRYAP